MDKRIKYIVSYDTEQNICENRVNCLASANKIDYIVLVLNRMGYKVDLISTSQTLNKKCYRGKKIDLGNGNKLILFTTTWRGKRIAKIINALVMRICIAFYLIKHTNKKEKVMVYHSAGNMWLISFLRKIKKTYIIEEVEEIYGEIFGNSCMAKLEKMKLSYADAYIFPTILIDKIVNLKRKPYAIVHGSYQSINVNMRKEIDRDLFEPNKKHIGYTGILDPKKGCLDVIKAAEYLDGAYHIHILGFGTDLEVNKVNAYIGDVQVKTDCIVTYDGIRIGKKYDEYLKNLDVGICPLNVEHSFVDSQFPSKVISYLVSGISVLCSRVKSVTTSDVASSINFYQGNKPEDIARAVKDLFNNPVKISPSELLKKCDKKFEQDLYNILEEK